MQHIKEEVISISEPDIHNVKWIKPLNGGGWIQYLYINGKWTPITTKSVFNDSCKNIDEIIDESIKKIQAVHVTYDELFNLRENSELSAGTLYRITDYVTTVNDNDEDIGCAGHPFDIIVIATSTCTLSEDARAIWHSESKDDYFWINNAKLPSWKLKYCLDNDIHRFMWADIINGKGVIYNMIDENNNECPYDFKNILFKRFYTNGGGEYNTPISGYYAADHVTPPGFAFKDPGDYMMCYTFTLYGYEQSPDSPPEEIIDLSINSSTSVKNNKVCQLLDTVSDGHITTYGVLKLPDIVFYGTSLGCKVQNNIINGVSNTISGCNIIIKGNSHHTIAINCNDIIINNNSNSIFFGTIESTFNNTINCSILYCHSINIKIYALHVAIIDSTNVDIMNNGNNITILNSTDIKIGGGDNIHIGECADITIGDECYNISIGEFSGTVAEEQIPVGSPIIIGSYCSNLEIGSYVSGVIIGNNCTNIVIDDGTMCVKIGNICNDISLSQASTGIVSSGKFKYITIGDGCSKINFEEDCSNITICNDVRNFEITRKSGINLSNITVREFVSTVAPFSAELKNGYVIEGLPNSTEIMVYSPAEIAKKVIQTNGQS